jgi:energy-converting hydrogenase Eha subunit B
MIKMNFLEKLNLGINLNLFIVEMLVSVITVKSNNHQKANNVKAIALVK